MILKDKKIVKNKPPITVFDCIKKINVDLEQVFNLDIVAQNRIAKRYFKLITQSILNLCFKDLSKAIYKDFDNNFVLIQLKNMIRQVAQRLFAKKQQNIFGYCELLQIKILVHLFLNQLRYDSNIWLNLSKKDTKSLVRKPTLYWNLAIMLIDFNILEEVGLKFSSDQKEILNLLFTIKKEDSFDEIKTKLALVKNNYLPLRIFALEKEVLKTFKSKASKNKNYEKILYSTVFQMIAIFIRQNLRKKFGN